MTASDLIRRTLAMLAPLLASARNLLPIVAVIAVFQGLVFQQPLPNWGSVLVGLGLILIGLSLFVAGLQIGLFPIGEQMAFDFARKGSVPWIVAFAFALGFGTTLAEPALIAVAKQAAELEADQADAHDLDAFRRSYALTLRIAVAVAVGLALAVGVLRIILGWPAHYVILHGFGLLLALMPFAPSETIGLACDIGVITMSTITVPLTVALGIGLAHSIQGRNALADGFGIIAGAALAPTLLLMAKGVVGL